MSSLCFTGLAKAGSRKGLTKPWSVPLSLGDIAKGRDMMELVRAAGIARKGLQDALSPAGNPKQLGWFPISSPRTKIKPGRNTVAGKVTHGTKQPPKLCPEH